MNSTITQRIAIVSLLWHDLALGFIIGAVCFLSGCSSKRPSDRPQTYPVTGIVTYQDKPVDGATVTFIGEKYSATGKTDANGRYRLTTFQPGDGAVPGEYQVIITKFIAPTLQDNQESEPSGDEVQQPVFKSELPEKYANPQTSHLRAKIVSGPTELDFPLR